MPLCSNMDELETLKLSEVSQRKNKYHMILLTCGIYIKGTNELVYETETALQMGKTNVWLPAVSVGRDKLGVWDRHIYTAI